MRKSSFWCLNDPHWCETSAVANLGALAEPGGLSQERVLRRERVGKSSGEVKAVTTKGRQACLGRGQAPSKPGPPDTLGPNQGRLKHSLPSKAETSRPCPWPASVSSGGYPKKRGMPPRLLKNNKAPLEWLLKEVEAGGCWPTTHDVAPSWAAEMGREH